jgi:hypothetical protein
VSKPKEETKMTALTILADPALDTEKFMLEGIDTSAKPLYSVSTMAQVFFARSSHWVRWLEAEGMLVLDGEPLIPVRTDSNARKYDLALIEKIAHALASNKKIEISQLRHALTIVKTQAQMYNYIT